MLEYPLTMPSRTQKRIGASFIDTSVVNFRSSKFCVEFNQLATQGANLQYDVYNLPGSRWKGEYTLPKMNNDAARKWIAFLTGLRGRDGTFYAVDPDYQYANESPVYIHRVFDSHTILVLSYFDYTTSLGWNNPLPTKRLGDYVAVAGRLHQVVGIDKTNPTSLFSELGVSNPNELVIWRTTTGGRNKSTWRWDNLTINQANAFAVLTIEPALTQEQMARLPRTTDFPLAFSPVPLPYFINASGSHYPLASFDRETIERSVVARLDDNKLEWTTDDAMRYDLSFGWSEVII